MNTILLVTVLLGAITLIQALQPPYIWSRNLGTNRDNVVETIKRAAEIGAMRQADKMPMMQKARQMAFDHPRLANRMMDVVRKSYAVRRAAAEEAVKRAVDIGVIKRSSASKSVMRMMDSRVIQRAAMDGVAKRMSVFDPTKEGFGQKRVFVIPHPLPDPTKPSFPEPTPETVMDKIVTDTTKAARRVLRKNLRNKHPKTYEALIKKAMLSDEVRDVATMSAVRAASKFNRNTVRPMDIKAIKKGAIVSEGVKRGVLRAAEEMLTDNSKTRTNGIETLSKAFRLATLKNAAMEAAMDIAGRLGFMRRAAVLNRSNNDAAINMVKKTALDHTVRMAAARRALEKAVETGVIDKRSQTPEMVARVAKLPVIKRAATMGAIKKAIEMGITTNQ